VTSVYLKGGQRIDSTYLSTARWTEAVLHEDVFIEFQYAGSEGMQDYNPEGRRVTLLVAEIAGVKERADGRG
jgi:hypothetical protein